MKDRDRDIFMGRFTGVINTYAVRRNVPLRSYLEITRKCNFNCVHCYLQNTLRENELNYYEICSVIDQLAAVGCFFITLTGGEPLIRPDFWDIVKHARKRGFAVLINTNASLITERIIKLLRESCIYQIDVSLYGMTENSYNLITGKKENFRKAWEGLNLLIKLWKKKQLPSLLLKMMIFRETFYELDRFIKFGRVAGIPSRIAWLYHPRLDKGRSKVPIRYIVSRSQFEELARKYPEIIEPEMKFIPSISSKICNVAFRKVICVNAYGEVSPCPQMNNESNVREMSLKDIIQNDLLNIELGKCIWKDIPTCRKCKALRFCNPCPADFMAYTNKLACAKPPKELCRNKFAWEKKKLYERFKGEENVTGSFQTPCLD